MNVIVCSILILVAFLLVEERHSSEDHDKSINELRHRIEKLEGKDGHER